MDQASAGAAVSLVMPWFFPLATRLAWLGATALWMLSLMSLPLIFWFIAQFTTPSGAFE